MIVLLIAFVVACVAGWILGARAHVAILRGQKADLDHQLTIERERTHEYEVALATERLKDRG